MILGCAAMLIVVGFGLVFFESVFKLILSLGINSADLVLCIEVESAFQKVHKTSGMRVIREGYALIKWLGFWR